MFSISARKNGHFMNFFQVFRTKLRTSGFLCLFIHTNRAEKIFLQEKKLKMAAPAEGFPNSARRTTICALRSLRWGNHLKHKTSNN